ncbi:MAG: malectin domain-containing carbohydrate-binding protein [Ignavibacteriota bacterium]
MIASVAVGLAEKRAELEAVLHSKEFYRAPSLAKLLEYLFEKTISGHTVEIKEFSIATEVFGKDLDFGEKRDSFVRVAVHRLRRKLEHYYLTEGATHSLRIVIKPGKYEPEFERVCDAAGLPACPTDSAGASLLPQPIPSAPPAAFAEERPFPELPEDPPGWLRNARLWRYSAVVITAIMVIALPAWMWLRKSTTTREAEQSQRLPPTLTAAEAGSRSVRIMAGSTADRLTDRFGNEWRGDRFFSGGYQDSLRFGNQERSVVHPFILGAPDQMPYRNFRSGDFSYRIPLAPGKYELRLHFSEVVFGLGASGEGADNQRVFDVNLNGHPLLNMFDVFTEAGAANTSDIRVFENVSPTADGYLTLDFRPIREAAWLNAIELIPNPSGHAQPLRIVAQDTDLVDHNGQVWGSDRYFVGGRTTSDGKVPTGTTDPDLFVRQRYGHFSYRMPVPPGKYRLRLLFAETFFGPGNRGEGGIGSRVFNVYCDGTAILRQFDIFKAAGANHAIEKVFYGIEPNAYGRIELTFEPVVNYAIVQAIELEDESRDRSR